MKKMKAFQLNHVLISLLSLAELGATTPIDLGSILSAFFGTGSNPSTPPTTSTVDQEVQPVAQSPTTTLIPPTCFDSQSNLESYFSYNYPWGDSHNGAAKMSPAYSIASNGILTLTSVHTGAWPLAYNAGTVFAKQNFSVPKGPGGIDFSAKFQATTIKGTWPAFWLTSADGGWPPEIDIAEWKGDGQIYFNTFNTSSQVDAHPIPYPSPSDWHEVKCSLRDSGNGIDMSIKFWLDGQLIATQVGAKYIGAHFWLIIDLQMEGGSGNPGPTTSKYCCGFSKEIVHPTLTHHPADI